MDDSTAPILVFAVIVAVVLVVQIAHWFRQRRWRSTEPRSFLVEELGFERISDRFLIDTHVVRYEGVFDDVPVRVESGTGPTVSYDRIDFDFGNELPLGLRISSEHEAGVLTRVLRLREVEIGIDAFDDQFILLCRDEDRLRKVLDREVRRRLLDLREIALDVRLNDTGLHLHFPTFLEREEFEAELAAGARLAALVFRRALALLEAEAVDSEVFESHAFTPIPGAVQLPSTDEGSR